MFCAIYDPTLIGDPMQRNWDGRNSSNSEREIQPLYNE
jgi:hypothetical protein